MTLDYKLLGKRIRQSRKKRKMTQEQLAEKANRSPAFIGHIERGTRVMSLETLCELALALDCSTDELLGLEIKKVDEYACARELLALAQALAHGKKPEEGKEGT